jgi:hypothetical protein
VERSCCRSSDVELGFALVDLGPNFRGGGDAVISGELTLGVGLNNKSQAGEEGRHYCDSIFRCHVLAFDLFVRTGPLLGPSSANTPSRSGSLGFLLSQPHLFLRWCFAMVRQLIYQANAFDAAAN